MICVGLALPCSVIGPKTSTIFSTNQSVIINNNKWDLARGGSPFPRSPGRIGI